LNKKELVELSKLKENLGYRVVVALKKTGDLNLKRFEKQTISNKLVT